MIDAVAKARRNTRPGYPPRVMWRLWCLRFLLNEPYNVSLIERLRCSGRLRELCGLNAVPSGPTVSRFFRMMAESFPGVGEAFIVAMVNRLKKRLPDDMGRIVAVDSTDLESWGNGNRPDKVDLNSEWGRRTRKNTTSGSEGDTEGFYGRKAHTLVSDASRQLNITPVLRVFSTERRGHCAPLGLFYGIADCRDK